MKLTTAATALLGIFAVVDGLAPLSINTHSRSDVFLGRPTAGGVVSTTTACFMSDNKAIDDDGGDLDKEEESVVVPSLSNSVIPPPSQPQPPKRLDPLVRSLTRMDVDTSNAPTKTIPLLGEVVLDRSLYLLMPAAGFAVIGFVASVYVALTSTDEWVIPSESATASKEQVIQTKKANNDGCRGLCSQQDEDLEGLRTFMNQFSK